ncbi:hypothetical protein I4F81_006258 [Pyropia yezoensis]|uniref:Uncharacterized protein n=1 Tax=Pyropia yezoensis TaxID=2788 RepID=A0ACC3C043_PYRYE|nr:hypothetical protein I4F81_006258 [Neopyropia yezoensis]
MQGAPSARAVCPPKNGGGWVIGGGREAPSRSILVLFLSTHPWSSNRPYGRSDRCGSHATARAACVHGRRRPARPAGGARRAPPPPRTIAAAADRRRRPHQHRSCHRRRHYRRCHRHHRSRHRQP